MGAVAKDVPFSIPGDHDDDADEPPSPEGARDSPSSSSSLPVVTQRNDEAKPEEPSSFVVWECLLMHRRCEFSNRTFGSISLF